MLHHLILLTTVGLLLLLWPHSWPHPQLTAVPLTHWRNCHNYNAKVLVFFEEYSLVYQYFLFISLGGTEIIPYYGFPHNSLDQK